MSLDVSAIVVIGRQEVFMEKADTCTQPVSTEVERPKEAF